MFRHLLAALHALLRVQPDGNGERAHPDGNEGHDALRARVRVDHRPEKGTDEGVGRDDSRPEGFEEPLGPVLHWWLLLPRGVLRPHRLCQPPEAPLLHASPLRGLEQRHLPQGRQQPPDTREVFGVAGQPLVRPPHERRLGDNHPLAALAPHHGPPGDHPVELRVLEHRAGQQRAPEHPNAAVPELPRIPRNLQELGHGDI
mmetsp:Transcript_24686/g.78022  ORF Transcript_24686/g.78022 Transcript_24686/m.78022 type:complete len:201 (-) Transcript_24686:179-781(-)